MSTAEVRAGMFVGMSTRIFVNPLLTAGLREHMPLARLVLKPQ